MLIKLFLASILGWMNVLAFFPFYFWWCSMISFSGFFALMRTTATAKGALSLSLAYFIPYFMFFGCWAEHWLVRLVILSTCFYCGLLAVIWQGMLTWLTRQFPLFIHFCLFSVIWGTGEWIRGHLFSGIPWNTISYITLSHAIFSQTAALWGLYGLVIPTAFVLTAPAGLLLYPKRKESWISCLIALSLVAGGYEYGRLRLGSHPIAFWPDTRLRLVQTHFGLEDRLPELTDHLLEQHLDLTLKENSSSITAFIWPESALNHHYIEDLDPHCKRYNQFVAQIGKKIPPKSLLIGGFYRASIIEIPPFTDGIPSEVKIQSRQHGLGVINQQGLVAWHTKSHLVPFIEYDPLLDKTKPLSHNLDSNDAWKNCDFRPGLGPSLIEVPGLPSFTPIICYEILFPSNIVCKSKARPAWILVVADDFHYQGSHYPFWMREMARMRSIEEGLPLVRVANFGSSSAYDGLGRALMTLPESQAMTVDIELPKPVPQTLYSQYGDMLFWSMTAAISLPILIRYRRRISI